MRYLDVCAGISASTVAWKPLGWEAAAYSEIEAAPRAILSHHYPDTPLHGDFTTIRGDEYGPVDLLVGGTPCQDFSIAGLREGLAGERGNLSLEYLRLADRARPRWLVWENVPGVLSIDGGRAFGAILGGLAELGYGFAYRILDAQFFGVPQRRRRVFVVGYLGDWRRAAAVLFERHSLSGHPAPRREARQNASAIPAQSLGGSGVGTDFDCDGGRAAQGTTPCGLRLPGVRGGERRDVVADMRMVRTRAFGGNNTSGPIDVATALSSHGGPHGGPHGRLDFESETFVAHALRGEGFDASEDGTGRGTPLVPVAYAASIAGSLDASMGRRAASPTGDNCVWQSIAQASAVRRLTPRECERLQGFPDDYTLVPYRGRMMADGPRYKALGNSMAVPVMRWIGERIAAVDALVERIAA